MLAGPVEATAAGNVLIQAITLGHTDSLEEARKIVRASLGNERFLPVDAEIWRKHAKRVETLVCESQP